MPYESLRPSGWPDIPFVNVDGIPLSFSLGYAGSGVPEPAENYLKYCRAYGRFSTELFAKVTSASATNALNPVFKSEKWKALKWKDGGVGWNYAIDEEDTKERLWKQVENMAKNKTSAAGSGR